MALTNNYNDYHYNDLFPARIAERRHFAGALPASRLHPRKKHPPWDAHMLTFAWNFGIIADKRQSTLARSPDVAAGAAAGHAQY